MRIKTNKHIIYLEVVLEQRSFKELYTKKLRRGFLIKEYKWVDKVRDFMILNKYVKTNSENYLILTKKGTEYLKKVKKI